MSYSGNGSTGGAVPAGTTAFAPGATVTVLGNTGNLVRSGFTFAGWDAAVNGSGAGYAVGDTFPMGTSNVTLYAQWTPAAATYAVAYTGNGNTGGTAPVDANSYAPGATVTTKANYRQPRESRFQLRRLECSRQRGRRRISGRRHIRDGRRRHHAVRAVEQRDRRRMLAGRGRQRPDRRTDRRTCADACDVRVDRHCGDQWRDRRRHADPLHLGCDPAVPQHQLRRELRAIAAEPRGFGGRSGAHEEPGVIERRSCPHSPFGLPATHRVPAWYVADSTA
ncbi:MAG: InlB B-repeat-containing protein [Betaproteobacteria bacterium]|nr:InlB B-repeat-containing protein [Betaproteobacteria bacterium]